MTKKEKLLLIVFGSVTGLINGFFGGGGGMIVVPVMTLIMKIKPNVAHATAIAVILPVSIISVITYFLSGATSVNLSPILSVGGGVVAGGIIGALLLKKINNKLLIKIFAVVMLIAGVKMIFS